SGVQRQMEGAMGADLSGVRVHTDGEADHLARSVDSVAFTTGNDIFFRSGAYNPGTAEGQHLLAHEATHTIQQAQGPVAGTPRDGEVPAVEPAASEEELPAQTPRAGHMPAVHRAADDEELPAQTMRAGHMPAVQRAADEEELPAQTMRAGQMPSLQ